MEHSTKGLSGRIVERAAQRIIGMRIITSLSNSGTREMWQKFGPLKKTILGRIDQTSMSVQLYHGIKTMKDFGPNTEYEQWAAVPVNDDAPLPPAMEETVIPGGKYAVFIHKGTVEDFGKTAMRIYGEWLPKHGLSMDSRPHFEILDGRYLGPMNPLSEEEVWVPVK